MAMILAWWGAIWPDIAETQPRGYMNMVTHYVSEWIYQVITSEWLDLSIVLINSPMVRQALISSIIAVLVLVPACGGSGETGKWVLGKSIFLPRHSFSSVVFDGQFYVMGGWVGRGRQHQHS